MAIRSIVRFFNRIQFGSIEVILLLPNPYVTRFMRRNHKVYVEIGLAWLIWRVYYQTQKHY